MANSVGVAEAENHRQVGRCLGRSLRSDAVAESHSGAAGEGREVQTKRKRRSNLIKE
jgi:hypothetical protein